MRSFGTLALRPLAAVTATGGPLVAGAAAEPFVAGLSGGLEFL